MKLTNADSLLLETPCRLEAVRDAARVLRTFLATNGLQEVELDNWELVAVEAGNNAVQYASPCSTPDGVRFLVNAWPESVELCVSDYSEGFDLPESFALPEDHSEGGRGLYLISMLTDSMRYIRGRRENILILRRARQQHRRPITDVQRDANLEETLHMMTEELGACYESLSAIFRFSSDLGRTGDSRACAVKWLNELMRVTRTDWYVLRQFDPKTGGLKVISAASSQALKAQPSMLLHPESFFDLPVELEAAKQSLDIWIDECTPRSAMQPLIEIFGNNISGLIHPIFVGTQLYAVLSIGMHTPRVDLSMSQVKIIHTFADFLGLQLSNDEIQQEAIQARLVTKELQVAAGIQRSLLPKNLPSLPGFTLAAHSQSAHAVGGDFYDAIEVGDEGVLFAIADVMGKGVPAAMFAAMFRSHLRASAELIRTPARMLSWLNHALFADLDGVDMFVTTQLVYFDRKASTLTVASAGHYPAFLCDGAHPEVLEFNGDGPPLGITRNPMFLEHTLRLSEPTRLLMLTDGLVEVRNTDGETMGHEAVCSAFQAAVRAGLSASEIGEKLLQAAARHQKDTPPSDDITFLLLVEGSDKNNISTPDPGL